VIATEVWGKEHERPTGGRLDDVRRFDTIIASTDVVAADVYAATLFGMTGKDIPYIRMGAEMGLGEMDLNKVEIEQIQRRNQYA
jgi:uncharacterized protein (DUF362 family)